MAESGLFKQGRLFIIVLLALPGPACHAKGKSLGPLQVPKFVEANNGLAVAAAIRGGDFVSKVALHFLGLDPPLVWVRPPKYADIFPAWVDDPVAMPATAIAIGTSACGAPDYAHLAAALREEMPSAPAPSGGLIHVEAPPLPGPAAGDLGSREIYGRCD